MKRRILTIDDSTGLRQFIHRALTKQLPDHALTFAGAAWGFNVGMDREVPTMSLTDDFMRTLLVSSVLRYLAVAHFGRGRGNFVESEAPPFWQEEVEQAVALHDAQVKALWHTLREQEYRDLAPASAVLTAITAHVLARLYPEGQAANPPSILRPAPVT